MAGLSVGMVINHSFTIGLTGHGWTNHNGMYYSNVTDTAGAYLEGGYGGQGLYISPRRELVIAYFGTPLDANMQTHELEWITRQLVKSGLFDN